MRSLLTAVMDTARHVGELYVMMIMAEHRDDNDACIYVSFGQGSSLLWTHTLRPLYSRPIALTQEGRSLVNDVCVSEG